MTKIKHIAFTTLLVTCFSMLHAQNDMITEPDNTTNYDALIKSNYTTDSLTKVDETETETEIETEVETKALVQDGTEITFFGNWIIGAGINSVEDSGKQNLSNLFESKYNHLGSPFMLSAEYLINNRWSASTTFLFNKFQSGKEIQGLSIQSGDEPNYFAVDFGAKRFVRKILDKYKFTPYVTGGLGYRRIEGYQATSKTGALVNVPKTQDVTANVGLGAYYWINRTWGLNLNYTAKFALKKGANRDFKTNHMVLGFGGFYRFDTLFSK